MHVRHGLLGLLTALSLTGCLSKHEWSTEVADTKGLEVTSTSRAELESRRSKAIDGGDVPALIEYMAYLWQFDREHRDWLALVAVGKSPRLPEALSGFDRKAYTDEAIAAWMAVRPPELPRSAARVELLRADFYATALTGGCRDTVRAMGPLLIVVSEEHGETASMLREGAVMESECGHEADAWQRACGAAAELLADMPEPAYDDLDGDMWPDPSLLVTFADHCRNSLSAEQRSTVDAFHRGAERWFAEHYPEEHQAWREEMARRAEAQRQAEARAAAERAAEAAAYSSSSGGGSSAPAGGGIVNVRLYNACNATVRLFFGDNPGFGSGVERTVSYNTNNSYSMREGEMIWIISNGQPTASYSASAGNRDIQITSSCGGFAPR